ncbi:MAG: hypothetical protein FJY43_01585 [Betaproteobacteria bacterium]|nr:hypothetical protein [Betaproteobacteria bacterium]
MSADESASRPAREPNALFRRVDELARQNQAVAQEEVPLLTEIADPADPAPGTAPTVDEEALAADLERALVARLAPELDRRLTALRADLEKELRRAIRDAVAHALAARHAEPPKD